MSKEKIFTMLEDAKQAGVLFYVAMGGEPLLRKDLPDILRYAKKLGFVTSVVTNGYYLKERHAEILPFTDMIVVSIDSNDELHDTLRGVKGIREKAIEGIKACKGGNTLLSIYSVICTLNLEKIDGLVKLSQDLDIPITFQPMDVYKGYNDHLRPSGAQLTNVFSKILTLKKAGHKISDSTQYIKYIQQQRSYVCHAPKSFIYIEADGTIFSCKDILDKPWGNVKDCSFKEIFHSDEFKEFCHQVESCNLCSVACVIEGSLAHSLDPLFIVQQAIATHFSFMNVK